LHPHGKSSATIAVYIPPELLALEVTTPGGGGDNVRYFPYRDFESGYRKVLNNVFSGAVQLTSAPDYSRLSQQGIDYFIQPEIVTQSGGSGLFTWPPTNFSVDLTNTVRNQNGLQVATSRVLGVGTAETSDRLSEHGIAGRRAMEDALAKLQIFLADLKLSTNMRDVAGAINQRALDTKSLEQQLGTLKGLLEKGLLTKEEYELKRKKIIDLL
jgi:hypothetical protein